MTRLNIALFASMPSASVMTVTAVNTGADRRTPVICSGSHAPDSSY